MADVKAKNADEATPATTNSSSSSFIVIEWSINKVFTVLQNFKRVQLNELVTCKVNNTKDIGKVIFIGTETDCNNMLESYKKKRLARKKNHKNKIHASKLNLPIFFNRPSLNSSTSNLATNEREELLKPSANPKFALRYRSMENELNNCDREVAHLTGDKNRHKHAKAKHSIDYHAIRTTPASNSEHVYRHEVNSRSSIDSSNLNVCHECECCRQWERESRGLSERLRSLENLFAITPEIVAWFEALRIVCREHREMDISDQSVLSTSNFSLSPSVRSSDLSARNEKNAAVPEIVIENIV